MGKLKSSGRVMCYATHSSATAQSYTAGFKASLPSTDVFDMGPSPGGDRYRGVKISLNSEGVGATVEGCVWAFWPAYIKGTMSPKGYEAHCIATLTGVSTNSITLPSGHVSSVAVYGCDTMTGTTTTVATTPAGPGAVINTALGSAGIQVFSPSDAATPAIAYIPDCGNPAHVYVELYDAGGDACNGFIEGIV